MSACPASALASLVTALAEPAPLSMTLKPLRRAVALAGVTASVLVAGLLAAQTTTAGAATERHDRKKPTVVLVHGAFAGSSSWDGVAKKLKQDGYPVIAAPNPLRGVRSDAQYLRSLVDSIRGPVVLAGHSYGGTVLSEAADGAKNVKALVYIASFQLEPGESTNELASKYPGGELGPALQKIPFPIDGQPDGTDLYIQQDKFRAVFAADLPRHETDLLAINQRPIAASALDDKATKAAWKTIPSWTLITTQDLAIPAESMRFMAKRAKSQTVEIDASHAVTISEPEAVAKLIDRAARATN